MEVKKATDQQYQIAAARRNHFDNLLWQTPVISMTAEAFLFSIALGTSPSFERQLASALALIISLASAHLMIKHRLFERHYAILMNSIEETNDWPTISNQAGMGKGIARWRAFKVWMGVYICFGVAAVLALFRARGIF